MVYLRGLRCTDRGKHECRKGRILCEAEEGMEGGVNEVYASVGKGVTYTPCPRVDEGKQEGRRERREGGKEGRS